jgi:hypothetical protein
LEKERFRDKDGGPPTTEVDPLATAVDDAIEPPPAAYSPLVLDATVLIRVPEPLRRSSINRADVIIP